MYPVITHLLFDLDCTLYSAHWGLEHNVSRRINDFLADYLAMPLEEAWALRKASVPRYGTTLEWLRAEQGLKDAAEIERYFAAVHPEDEADKLPPDPQLRSFLLSLSLPMAILTNSPPEHAHRILNKLGVADLFPTIFDIRRNGLEGKPSPGVYCRALAELGVEAPSCLFVDDASAYVEAYRALGGTGVYFDEDNHKPEYSAERAEASEGSPPALPGFRIQKLEDLRNLSWPDNSPVLN
jgi:putative hydrolase of the HAD superfamily